MDEQVIVAENLTRVFNKDLTAVDHVNFSVQSGEIFGFLGPNGAGKTTTINMLTTLLRPTAGKGWVCGYDIGRQQTQVRRCIGVVPQEYTADEDLTGYENIVLCAHLYGIPRDESRTRAIELLKLVGLESSMNRKVETYSGGMRRRLELACGLVNRPRVLFLDEPTLGLDVQTRTAVWDYIRLLKTQYHMTLFMTTHYLEEADNLCGRVGIIDRGKILKLDSPSALKSSLGGDVIELATEDAADITALLAQVPRVKEVKKLGDTYRLKVAEGEKAAPEIIETVRSSGGKVIRIALAKPTLDEVYLELTGRSLREQEGSDVWKQRLTIMKARGRS